MAKRIMSNTSYEENIHEGNVFLSSHVLFSRIETVLTFIVGLFIVGFVIISLLGVITEIREPLLITHNFTEAALKGIDVAFWQLFYLSYSIQYALNPH